MKNSVPFIVEEIENKCRLNFVLNAILKNTSTTLKKNTLNVKTVKQNELIKVTMIIKNINYNNKKYIYFLKTWLDPMLN